MWTHWTRRFTTTGACAPAWLAATSTHIEAAAPAAVAATPTRRTAPEPATATATATPVATTATTRSTAAIPSDEPKSPVRVSPAASRCASTIPKPPRAQAAHAAPSAGMANRGTSRSATRQVAAIPTIPIAPMKNSQRATTARIEGGGDTTAFAACAFALDADTPTPKAYAPVARCPSTSDTVRQVTV